MALGEWIFSFRQRSTHHRVLSVNSIAQSPWTWTWERPCLLLHTFSALREPWAHLSREPVYTANGAWEISAWLPKVLPLEPPWSMFPYLLKSDCLCIISRGSVSVPVTTSQTKIKVIVTECLYCANTWKAKSLTYIISHWILMATPCEFRLLLSHFTKCEWKLRDVMYAAQGSASVKRQNCNGGSPDSLADTLDELSQPIFAAAQNPTDRMT